MNNNTRTNGRAWCAWAVPLAALLMGAAPHAANAAENASIAAGVQTLAARAPVTQHPRLWIRAQDLPTLQAWATSSNPMFDDRANGGGLLQLALTAAQRVEDGTVPGQDNGGSTYTPYPTESYAALLAFMSLVDSDTNRRARWIRTARTALFAVIDEADKGVGPGKFRSPSFANSDRGRWHGESFPLAVDWLYPQLSAAERQRIRRVFLRWCAEDRDGYPSVTYYNTHPNEVPKDASRRNNPALLDLKDPKRSAVRYAMNNYFMAHARNIFMMGNAIDPADDQVDPKVPNDRAGALGDFMDEAIGTYLYMTDYAYRNDGKGGISPEGAEYGESIGFYYGLLLALNTSGRDDTARDGKKVSFTGNPVYKTLLPGYYHSLTTKKVATDYGSVYQPSWFGDGEQLYLQDPMRVMGPNALGARYAADAATLNGARWMEYVAPPDNPGRLSRKANNDDAIVDSIYYFLLFDPASGTPTDPRAGLKTYNYAPGIGRIQARTSWADGNKTRLFDYKLSYNTIDHQHGDGNSFDFWRKGEWLTKEFTAYGAGAAMSEFKNAPSVQNNPNAQVGDYQHEQLVRGSQFLLGNHDGDPKVLLQGQGKDFVTVTGDATNLYNFDNGWVTARDVSHVSRSLLWLQPDALVLMDRTKTTVSGRFKRFNLMLPSNGAAPVVSGDKVVASTPGNQRLEVRTLLPASGSRSIQVEGPTLNLPDSMWKATLDPMSANKSNWTGGYRLRVENPGQPAAVNFLHVLQGYDAGATAATTQLLRSNSGTAMSGALVGSTATLFVDDLSHAITSFTVPLPAAAHRLLLAGTVAKAAYTVSVSVDGQGARTLHVSAGGTQLAGAHGVLDAPLP
ncbi:hypothetical protein [Ideonella sp.]|uniref:hypothetical protein n=1 Tax=Ideonella sp. TaxID=1929293 RepID=UPI0035AEB729